MVSTNPHLSAFHVVSDPRGVQICVRTSLRCLGHSCSALALGCLTVREDDGETSESSLVATGVWGWI